MEGGEAVLFSWVLYVIIITYIHEPVPSYNGKATILFNTPVILWIHFQLRAPQGFKLWLKTFIIVMFIEKSTKMSE